MRLRLLETKADGRACTALCAVGCAARGTKYLHQDFTCFATDGPSPWTDLTAVPPPRIALCTGRTLRSLRPLRTLLPLCPLLPLWPSNTLQALRALRTGGALSAGFPFGPGSLPQPASITAVPIATAIKSALIPFSPPRCLTRVLKGGTRRQATEKPAARSRA